MTLSHFGETLPKPAADPVSSDRGARLRYSPDTRKPPEPVSPARPE